jgi:glyoxylase-like metal-dependent hydrolase (beta-lactamase superfamily II)
MFRFRIGDIEVSQVVDFVQPGTDLQRLLPGLRSDDLERNIGWLAPHFIDAETRQFAITIQSWLIKTQHHLILVDSCGGNHKSRAHFPAFDNRETPYLANLQAAGATPDDIDFVFCTHLHIDHVGWNTRLENGRWVPTFPNARYLFAQADYDHITPAPDVPQDTQGEEAMFFDSVLPIVEAGLATLIGPAHAIDDSIMIEARPGHSPGHSILRACSQGQSGLFSGDALHHPLQIALPELNSFACLDADMARVSRKQILDECAHAGQLLVPAHFAAPHIGRVCAQQDAYRFYWN